MLDVIRTAGVPVGWLGIDGEGRSDDPAAPDTEESHGAWYVPDRAEGPVSTAAVLADEFGCRPTAARTRAAVPGGVGEAAPWGRRPL